MAARKNSPIFVPPWDKNGTTVNAVNREVRCDFWPFVPGGTSAPRMGQDDCGMQISDCGLKKKTVSRTARKDRKAEKKAALKSGLVRFETSDLTSAGIGGDNSKSYICGNTAGDDGSTSIGGNGSNAFAGNRHSVDRRSDDGFDTNSNSGRDSTVPRSNHVSPGRCSRQRQGIDKRRPQ